MTVFSTRLAEMGHHVGYRMIDVLCLRDKGGRYRETRMVNMLLYIKTTLWKVSECMCPVQAVVMCDCKGVYRGLQEAWLIPLSQSC